MTVTTPTRPHWRRTDARRLADLLLDVQAGRHELQARLANLVYLDRARRRLLAEALALWGVLAPVERRLQAVLEAEVAEREGREPPPAAPSARPGRLRRAL
jgi:hypothetical protein